MITKTTTYTDFRGNERTEEMCFNLTQIELTEMGMELPDDVKDVVGDDPSKIDESAAVKLIEVLGGKGIMEFLKTLILKAYGKVSEDGRRFEKSEEISKEFSQTIAFDNLMVELLSDDEVANKFVNDLIPSAAADMIPAFNKN